MCSVAGSGACHHRSCRVPRARSGGLLRCASVDVRSAGRGPTDAPDEVSITGLITSLGTLANAVVSKEV